MNEYKYDAYCGLYCGACEMHNALKNGTIKELAEKWNMDVKEITCHGCKSDVVFKWCRECNLKDCARSKGLEFCSECDEYPCDDLNKFVNDPKYPYHIEALNNLNKCKEIGKEKWLKEQEKRWSCKKCSKKMMWYDLECSDCKSKFNGYARPSE